MTLALVSRLVTFVVLLMAASAVGCKGKAKGPHPGAFIRAEPNPIPRTAGPGMTTLSWGTDSGSKNQVYVSMNGGPEKLVTENRPGSLVIKWILPNATYQFRLYSGHEHHELIASVQVQQARE